MEETDIIICLKKKKKNKDKTKEYQKSYRGAKKHLS